MKLKSGVKLLEQFIYFVLGTIIILFIIFLNLIK